MPPRKGAKKPAAKAYKLPDKIAQGQILTDVTRKQWRLGKSVGQGGFGEIYLASDITDKPVGDNANFVIKVEPHTNGPLFTEMHCYIRIAKPDFIENWKKEKKLKRLGMPKYLGSGSHEYQGQKYRFMVMERFGDDLQKIIERHDKKFSYKTVFQVVIQILDVLEYIHSYEYIHADIKASNLLVGFQPGTENQVFLVDYGLACRYKIDGKHKEYKYDQRKAHDGTIEFTSRDAHIGAHSRRGDLEILGYNLVQWLCGKLPWEDKLQDCSYVASKKRALMEDVPKFMNICFPNEIPPGIQEFVEYVASLTFDEEPNYEKCRNILREGLKKRGYKDDGKMVFMSATPKTSKISASKLDGRKVSKVKRTKKESDLGAEGVSPPPPEKRRRVTENIGEETMPTVMAGTSIKSKRKNVSTKKVTSRVSRKVATSRTVKKVPTRVSKRLSSGKEKSFSSPPPDSPKSNTPPTGQSSSSDLPESDNYTPSPEKGPQEKKGTPISSSSDLSESDNYTPTPEKGPQEKKSTRRLLKRGPREKKGTHGLLKRGPQKKKSTSGVPQKAVQLKEKTGQTKSKGTKRPECNGSTHSRASAFHNPTPHMLALMKQLKKE